MQHHDCEPLNGNAGPDRFAAIALRPAPASRAVLPHLPPLELPERRLESDLSDGLGVPPAPARLRTPEDLRWRLAELKERYAPFLEDHTPAAPISRPRLGLEEFSFRFETPEDRADSARQYGLAGDWEQVTIPHYRGPVGRWAAYYRTHFAPDAALSALGRVFLVFRGVDYRCQVFLNGVLLGSHEGFFAPFEFDVTPTLRQGENVLLVRVENDFPTCEEYAPSGELFDGDKIYAATGPGWDEPGVGWRHCPPGAGIYQPVYLEGRPAVFVSDLWVRPDIDREQAEVWVEVSNALLSKEPITLTLSLFSRNFQGVSVSGIASEVPPAGPGPNLYRIPLGMRGYRLWSPESPYLYTLRAEIQAQGSQDGRDVSFGMRKFHMDTAGDPKGTLYLNNEPVFLRGSNTMGHEQRCVMTGDFDQLVEDMLIYKAANLNYLRITQRPVQSEVYDVMDAVGLMHQCDLPLFGQLRYNQLGEAIRQAGEMERLVRRHPSAVMVSFINEPYALMPGSERHARMLSRPALEGFFAAATAVVHAHNPDRVVKPVDGDYDPPAPGLPDEHCYCFWYNNSGVPAGKLHQGWLLPLKPGWRGGCGEYGVEGLDSWETMRDCYPREWVAERPDAEWSPSRIYGSQTYAMHGKFFDAQDTLEQWVRESQQHQARGLRLMTDAFRRRADIMVSTVFHLGIDAWPAGWLKSIVDVNRRPKPAYFALADALAPLAVNLRTDRHQVYGGERLQVEAWALNDRPTAPAGLQLAWWVEREGQVLFTQRNPADVRPSCAIYQGAITWQTPAVSERSRFTVGLALLDGDGRTLHDHTVTVEAFPRPDLAPFRGRPVGILGQEGGRAWRFAQALGLQPLPFADAPTATLAMADHPDAAGAVGALLPRFLEAGGRLLCLEQEGAEGEWQFPGHRVAWRASDPCYFASRKTGHPAVAALAPFDVAWWYHPGEKRIEPTFHHVLEGEELLPLVFTTTSAPPGSPENIPLRHLVAAELAIGRGHVFLTQVEALCRFPSEPLAVQYLTALVQHLLLES